MDGEEDEVMVKETDLPRPPSHTGVARARGQFGEEEGVHHGDTRGVGGTTTNTTARFGKLFTPVEDELHVEVDYLKKMLKIVSTSLQTIQPTRL